MGVFSRSWQLTKVSFAVIKQDKEMLLFPLLAGLSSLAFSIALLFPTVIVRFTEQASRGNPANVALSVLDYVLMFVTYLGLAFIATFFNVCVVFTTKTRFEGGDATFGQSFKFALSRISRIFAWSMVAATVGMFLHALDRVAERAGGVGKIVISIARAIIGGVWSVMTIFVVPVMVYEDLGPVEAIKRSMATLQRTWGESLVRSVGLGLIQFLFLLLGVVMAVGLFMVLGPLGGWGVLVALIVSVIYFIGVVLLFSVATTVFNTALFAYANGRHPEGFDDTLLQAAFGPRK